MAPSPRPAPTASPNDRRDRTAQARASVPQLRPGRREASGQRPIGRSALFSLPEALRPVVFDTGSARSAWRPGMPLRARPHPGQEAGGEARWTRIGRFGILTLRGSPFVIHAATPEAMPRPMKAWPFLSSAKNLRKFFSTFFALANKGRNRCATSVPCRSRPMFTVVKSATRIIFAQCLQGSGDTDRPKNVFLKMAFDILVPSKEHVSRRTARQKRKEKR